MNVEQVMEDLGAVISENEGASEFMMAVACYLADGSGNISVHEIGAFEWDEDDELYLIPQGSAHHYDLEDVPYTAGDFLSTLIKGRPEKSEQFEVFARSSIKVLPDGSIASIGSPVWATGIHHGAQLVYFYYGDQPDAT